MDAENTLQQQAADLFGVMLTDDDIKALDILTNTLIDWNQRMNLTTITEPAAIQVRHHLDSLSVVGELPFDENTEEPFAGLRVVDVGAGAGFPGLPLAIAFPAMRVTLLETTGKKVNFMQQIIDTLKLTNAKAIKARAEDAGHEGKHRAQYDVALARAVARLPTLLEYTLPLIRIGGRMIAMKGEAAFAEVEDSVAALRELGGKVDDIVRVQLPGVEHPHYLVVVEKISRTPKAYPRQAGTPKKEPIA